MIVNVNCNIIAVAGGKGGVGKSVFAANLAAALMLELRNQVLLIDADAKSCGDQNVILGLRPQKIVAEVAQFNGTLGPQAIGQMVTAHPSGLAYIGAVRGPEESLNPNIDLFLKQLEFLSRTYKFIVIDVGNDLGPFQLALLNEATAITVVCTPEILVVNQTQRLIHELLTNTFPMEMFQLVINKASNAGINPQSISQSLRLPIAGMIPLDDITTANSLQRSTPFVLSQSGTPISAAYHDFVRKITGGTLQRLKSVQRAPAPQPKVVNSASGTDGKPGETVDIRNAAKVRIHDELTRVMNWAKGITDTQGDPEKEKLLKQKTLQSITQIIDKDSPGMPREERSKIIKEVLEEALGLGPLEDLLADPSVTEIMVNGHKKIFIEKSGKLTMSPITFTSNIHLKTIIDRIVMPLGRQINSSVPYVDARLKDGSRVNAIIEPLSIDGPALTIRKFKKGGISVDKYIEFGSISRSMIDFLKICVENGINVVISGGTGSGKTSLLNMLSGFIPATNRIVTVEDAAELQLIQEHVVRLETRPPSSEGTGAVTIRDLIRNSLRMRPDRIIVGECRDGAALDMLQAMNTGHDGSMTTTHANTPRECLSRLETLCMMAEMDLSSKAIREQVSSAVHLIVQASRLSDGSRKVTHITEITGMEGEKITSHDIFLFKETHSDKNRKIIGQFQAVGNIPHCIQKLEKKGIKIPRHIFTNENKVAAPTNDAMKNSFPANFAPMKKTGTGDKP